MYNDGFRNFFNFNGCKSIYKFHYRTLFYKILDSALKKIQLCNKPSKDHFNVMGLEKEIKNLESKISEIEKSDNENIKNLCLDIRMQLKVFSDKE